MKTETNCPECNYPMETRLHRQGSRWLVRIEYFMCDSCGHKERVPSKTEEMNLENEKI